MLWQRLKWQCIKIEAYFFLINAEHQVRKTFIHLIDLWWGWFIAREIFELSAINLYIWTITFCGNALTQRILEFLLRKYSQGGKRKTELGAHLRPYPLIRLQFQLFRIITVSILNCFTNSETSSFNAHPIWPSYNSMMVKYFCFTGKEANSEILRRWG